MKGIILAGGSGTRLGPSTDGVSKQMLDIYDKPMIYYPLSTLMSAGIRDILVITTEEDQKVFMRQLQDGSKFGIHISYKIQPSPDGLAQAFLLGEDFIGDEPCAMILGDNIFYGTGFYRMLDEASKNAYQGKATIFGNQVKDPERFGIMELDSENNVISVEEKPKFPKSDYAIVGLYFYPSGVSELAKRVEPSARGELEITTLNDFYLQQGLLKAELLESGFAWFDAGTHDSKLDASNMIRTIQNRTGQVVCCPEVVAYEKGWLTEEELGERAKVYSKNNYGKYLKSILKEK